MQPKILTIVGTTASGKSALAVLLAKKFDGEIISADSRQVYRGLDIGSGKVTKKEMSGIRHHLLDVANPKKQFSVSDYKKLSEQAIAFITKKGKLPIVVGGTGLYIDALLSNSLLPEVAPNPNLRAKLEKYSVEKLFVMLEKLDPKRAKTIDKFNPRRLIRAIEIAKVLGSVPTLETKPSPWQIISIGLLPASENLKKRISLRLSKRLFGIVKEVKILHKNGLSWKRMEALGLEYRFASRYVRGVISKKEMTETLEKEIYQYAKRQMTWFKRNKDIHWFDPDKRTSAKKIVKMAANFVAKKA